MEHDNYRNFLMKIETSNSNILNAWNLLIARHLLEEKGFIKREKRYFAPRFWKKSTIIKALIEKNAILIKINISSEKILFRIEQVKDSLLTEAYRIFFSLEDPSNHKNIFCKQLIDIDKSMRISIEEL